LSANKNNTYNNTYKCKKAFLGLVMLFFTYEFLYAPIDYQL